MLDIRRLTLDATSNWDAIAPGRGGDSSNASMARVGWFPGYPALERFAHGLRADDGSNRRQHVGYSVAMAFKMGRHSVDLEAQYQSGIRRLAQIPAGHGRGRGSEMDLALSRQSIALGRAAGKRVKLSQARSGHGCARPLGKECDKAATRCRDRLTTHSK